MFNSGIYTSLKSTDMQAEYCEVKQYSAHISAPFLCLRLGSIRRALNSAHKTALKKWYKMLVYLPLKEVEVSCWEPCRRGWCLGRLTCRSSRWMRGRSSGQTRDECHQCSPQSSSPSGSEKSRNRKNWENHGKGAMKKVQNAFFWCVFVDVLMSAVLCV